MTIEVNRRICTGCGECIEICPVEAIRMIDKKASINGKVCMKCGVCMAACPFEAIEISELQIS